MGCGLVVGFTGPIAAGKSSLAYKLSVQTDFVYLRSRNVLAEMLEKQGLPITEENLQMIGKKTINEIGGAGLSALVLSSYSLNKNHVYDSIRHVKDLEYFRERFSNRFQLVFVDASETLRKERYLSRQGREASLKSYISRTNHPVEAEVPLMRREASIVIENKYLEQAFKQLQRQIKLWIGDIENGNE